MSSHSPDRRFRSGQRHHRLVDSLTFWTMSCSSVVSTTTCCVSKSPGKKSAQIFFVSIVLLMMLWVDPTSAGDNTKDHYAEHTVNYEAAFFYSPGEYTNYLKKIVQNQLGIDPTNDKAPKKRLLDIGGGTGVFTRMLIENTNMEAIVIDPYLPSNLGNPTSVEEEPDLDENNIIYVSSGAEAFINLTLQPEISKPFWWQQNYDLVLFKEIIHHVQAKDRIPIFTALYRRFKPRSHNSGEENTPSLLIVTRPQYDIDYPLWPEARQVWAKNQPSLESLTSDLKEAGFQHVDSTVEVYPCRVSVKTWLTLTRTRFWSTFSHFTNEEIEMGCQWIQDNIPQVSNIQVRADGQQEEEKWIEFEDRLLMIRGYL